MAGHVAAVSGVRLQKLLAAAGIGSRRTCEDMITQRRVRVNGIVVERQGMRVHPIDAIVVDGVPVAADVSARKDKATIGTFIHLALHKPIGVVSTMSDPQGRPTISDQLRDKNLPRLFHVGRLDQDTSGLLLLTNDGDFANCVSHPSHGVPKTYRALVSSSDESARSVPDWATTLCKRVLDGVQLEDGRAAADACKVLETRQSGEALLELEIHEGRNRIVRRIFETAGHPVLKLQRTKVGPVHLGSLKAGETRTLTAEEVNQLGSSAATMLV